MGTCKQAVRCLLELPSTDKGVYHGLEGHHSRLVQILVPRCLCAVACRLCSRAAGRICRGIGSVSVANTALLPCDMTRVKSCYRPMQSAARGKCLDKQPLCWSSQPSCSSMVHPSMGCGLGAAKLQTDRPQLA